MHLNKINFFNFNNKIVLLTGSSGLLGKKICEVFLSYGAKVYGVDIKNNNIKNKNYIHTNINLTDKNEISKFISKLINKNKKIDIIINSAAVSFFSPFEKRKKFEIEKTLSTNLIATINIIKKYVILHKKKKLKSCKIINFGSIYGSLSPNFDIYKKGDRFNSEIYGATKASIIQLTKYLGALYAKNKIIINCISPGGTIDVTSKISKSFRVRYSKKVPMNRMGKPEEMITTIMYLASDYTTYTVGQNIVVDGGFSVW